MKRTRSGILAIVLSFVMAATSAFAADGTITITGQITSQTCTPSGNGGSNNFTVTLPTVSASALTTAGVTAGRTQFNIALSKCTSGAGNVAVYFEPGATVNTTTGRLLNTAAGGATNVEIGLRNSDNSQIQLGAAQATQNSHSVAVSGGSATLTYYAEYVATGGAATTGNVTTTTMYSIVYQ